MILNINQPINPQCFQLFVDAYNNLPINNEGHYMDGLDVYFASEGGDNTAALAIIDIVNRHKNITTFTGYSHLYSNGFKIFFQVECEKKLLPETTGMYHLAQYTGYTLFEKGITKNSDFEAFMRKQMTNSKYLEETSSYVGFTEQELQVIKDNRDLWLDYNRLSKMLKYNQKKLKNEQTNSSIKRIVCNL